LCNDSATCDTLMCDSATFDIVTCDSATCDTVTCDNAMCMLVLRSILPILILNNIVNNILVRINKAHLRLFQVII